jgi:hypothetical protein
MWRRYDQPVPPGPKRKTCAAVDARCVADQCGGITESASRRQTASSRAAAGSSGTSSRGRASARSQKLPAPSSGAAPGLTSGSAAAATVMSAVSPTVAPLKPRGVTPTIGTGRPSIRIVLPITSSPPPYCRSQ